MKGPDEEQEPDAEPAAQDAYALPGFKWSKVFSVRRRLGDDGVGYEPFIPKGRDEKDADKRIAFNFNLNRELVPRVVQEAFNELLKNNHKFSIRLQLNNSFDPSRDQFQYNYVVFGKVFNETLMLENNIDEPFYMNIGEDTILSNNTESLTVKQIEKEIDGLITELTP